MAHWRVPHASWQSRIHSASDANESREAAFVVGQAVGRAQLIVEESRRDDARDRQRGGEPERRTPHMKEVVRDAQGRGIYVQIG